MTKMLLQACCLLAILLPAQGWSATNMAGEVKAHLDYLRSVQAQDNSKRLEEHNQKMDAAWAVFNGDKKAADPLLRKELVREISQASPNQMVLLDVGNYFSFAKDEESRQLAKQALYKIDGSAKVIALNDQDLFLFAYRLADLHEADMLLAFDRLFLPADRHAFVPQHAMSLDGTLICVFLYGKYGPSAEEHLRAQLSNSKLRDRVLELLIWLGTPASTAAVKSILDGQLDFDTFARVTAFMMQVAGPAGREAMLALAPDKLDAKSKEYYEKIKANIQSTSYASYTKGLSELPGYKSLTDQEIKSRLTLMYENFGKDDDLHPAAVLSSTLPKQYLIEELTRTRSRMLYRLSNEALSDVKTTAAILTALQYREK